MARMNPREISPPKSGEESPTQGEYELFRLLQDHLPDERFTCGWETALAGTVRERREPDFVIFRRNPGALWVIEVKDWRSEHIRQIDQHKAVVGSRETMNPVRQVKKYMDALRNDLRRHGISPEGGNLPVGLLVAMPFLSWDEFQRKGFASVLPPDGMLLREDFDPQSRTFLGASSESFERCLERVLPFVSPQLEKGEISKIEDALWPVIRQPPRVPDGESRDHFRSEVRYLDKHQNLVAGRLKPGHQLLSGPPGSGKTLVLAQRCHQLHRHYPDMRRILFLCFNIALSSYLSRLLQEQGLPVGPKGSIHVHHFYELCGRILDEKVEDNYEPYSEAGAYYRKVVARAAEAVRDSSSKVTPYDAILVDEGQDFDDEQIRLIRSLLRDGGDMIFAVDNEQNLYRRERRRRESWKSLGIDVRGSGGVLKRSYRSTAALLRFTECFRDDRDEEGQESKDLQQELPYSQGRLPTGDRPELQPVASEDLLVEAVTREVERAITKGYRRPEIAVLYDLKRYGTKANPAGFERDAKERSMGQDLKEALEARAIPVQWVSENSHAKRYFDITRDSVALMSVHSAKGLDYDFVVLVHRGWPVAPRKEWRSRLGPSYVAITRAKLELTVIFAEEDEVIRRMSGSASTRRPIWKG